MYLSFFFKLLDTFKLLANIVTLIMKLTIIYSIHFTRKIVKYFIVRFILFMN